MASDDQTRQQHDITTPPQDPGNTIDDQDEDQVDGSEVNDDLDEIHKEAFGDEDNLPIDEEIDKDEIARVKDLYPEEQKKKTPKSS